MSGTRHTFASYFALAIELILKALWREGFARGPQELIRLTWNRLRRLERRFNALVAQWRAGTLPARGSVRVMERTPPPGPLPRGEGAKTARAPWPFPRGYAWITRQLVPQTPPEFVGTLGLALSEPEMTEMYAAAPQLGRILRPLAHMIGAPLPQWLKLPKRVRARKSTSPRPSPQSGEGEEELPPHPLAARFPDTPPARAAARALARMQAGLPVDVTKLSSVAYGYFIHPPRDGSCPPPEIGYARARPPPKDYKPPKDWE
jgi:hypothetical protein